MYEAITADGEVPKRCMRYQKVQQSCPKVQWEWPPKVPRDALVGGSGLQQARWAYSRSSCKYREKEREGRSSSAKRAAVVSSRQGPLRSGPRTAPTRVVP